MRAFIRIGAAIGLSIGVALLISWIGELDGGIATSEGEPVAAFSDHRTRPLTEETIVDELVALGLTADIRRVAVGASMLEVDLAAVPEAADEAAILADMGSLARLALAESDNISRVFVRVLEPVDGKRGGTLLLALSGAKSEFREADLQRLRDGERMPDAWLSEKMRLTVTERWRVAAEGR
ncbi:hypothetical protein [Paenibacillus sp.]|uniref:hypothetical protein n=1 Tax=Paenibacillus sp. TaxID=58172 RepID=UPI002D26398C|nr:hypothetical protein [Paenibacillus sp.]HZG57469.1 hypothetical protein [Paenibacillus sp.]